MLKIYWLHIWFRVRARHAICRHSFGSWINTKGCLRLVIRHICKPVSYYHLPCLIVFELKLLVIGWNLLPVYPVVLITTKITLHSRRYKNPKSNIFILLSFFSDAFLATWISKRWMGRWLWLCKWENRGRKRSSLMFKLLLQHFSRN
jgi:hypothetical protein